MKTSIIIPHYRNGKTTAYAVSQFLKYKGDNDVTIIVGNNSVGDGSIEYLEPFKKDILIVDYPKDTLQSQGIIASYIIDNGYVQTDNIFFAESDSFPTKEFLPYYENILKQGNAIGASYLKLSGGAYFHPCGAIYSMSLYNEAKEYLKTCEYSYFPSAVIRNNATAHLMVHKSVFDKFIEAPEDYLEMTPEYHGLTKDQILDKIEKYSPVNCVFHNSTGMRQETIIDLSLRTIESEANYTVLDNKAKLITRIGNEPGQWVTYFAAAKNKKLYTIPTFIKWMENRYCEQQEYTENEAGIVHLWSVSSYYKSENPDIQDIVKFKENQVNDLYDSLPSNQKI